MGLVSVIMSSWGNDMSVYVVVANNIHHGSCMEVLSSIEELSLSEIWAA